MPYPQAVNEALEKLATTGIWRSNYAPPVYRLLWWAGISVPPPHFVGFVRNFVFSGGVFGIAWGAIMWFGIWSHGGMSALHAACATLFAGVFFGLVMALYYRHGARKYQLAQWK
ncbi:hypothetical protein LT85_5011 [Collimonas arenae]|uniref:Transmembrane protein n=1 Tax=Collimonas arenae TaxID=279058 RepID=A0A0A1FKG4_9BURK|nr:DUF6404 family protein [Collimonas arenae]AIY44169.1 hypothetical protein LT85_5011 [Collimonas arenae]